MTVKPTCLCVAQAKALRFRLVETRHVARRAGLDQRRDHGGAERAGAAGDHDVTIAKVHALLNPVATIIRARSCAAVIARSA